MTDFLSASYWENRYQQQLTGWDIGAASSPLAAYIEGITDTSIAVFIPGCGNAYEADVLVQKGFTDVTLIDIAPTPVQQLQQRFKNKKINIRQQDFFEHSGSYDLILEQTFFCALDSALRPAYIHKMYELLKPGGLLVGVLFNRLFEVGPPFGGNKEDYEKLFSKYLHIKKMELCYNSIKSREGTELFFIAEKKI